MTLELRPVFEKSATRFLRRPKSEPQLEKYASRFFAFLPNICVPTECYGYLEVFGTAS